MAARRARCQVAVVGGGPVGLLLACLLTRRGVSCRVLERSHRRSVHSRAIGIHPPSLGLLQRVAIGDACIERGVVVRRGHAFGRSGRLGSLDFDTLSPPHRFVLSLPQNVTEALLERRLAELAPGALARGAEVVGLELDGSSPRVVWRGAEGRQDLEAELVVGCDGKQSTVRRLAGIDFPGGPYPDSFVMGDFDDNTPHGADAAIYLHPAGLVECFPLPGGLRRWVLAVDRPHEAPTAADIAALVGDRLGHVLAGVPCHWSSSFGVQHHLARELYRGPVILCGDAAHVVSPLGGQGMNLGWLGAGVLADAIERRLAGDAVALESYQRRAGTMARRAIRRAELNMSLGRAPKHPALRDGLVRILLALPTRRLLARLFTMYGLERWPV